uniref:Uncharacterized protein n=1 Tax=Pararge aegeria TaxID=116150 RepID=S4P614_9NEOP
MVGDDARVWLCGGVVAVSGSPWPINRVVEIVCDVFLLVYVEVKFSGHEWPHEIPRTKPMLLHRVVATIEV